MDHLLSEMVIHRYLLKLTRRSYLFRNMEENISHTYYTNEDFHGTYDYSGPDYLYETESVIDYDYDGIWKSCILPLEKDVGVPRRAT